MITTNENFIRDYGNRPRQTPKGSASRIEDAYLTVAGAYQASRRQDYSAICPAASIPFPQTMLIRLWHTCFNPPERWFGDIGVLESVAFLRLKDQVKHEQECVINKQRTVETSLTECQQEILGLLLLCHRLGIKFLAKSTSIMTPSVAVERHL